ncbi:MAG: response regulator [Polyangiaceae bacterium]|nr:response regulator [Polyangiaceae bacterium]
MKYSSVAALRQRPSSGVRAIATAEVLVVDDEPAVRCVLEIGLSANGFRVTSCGDPIEALAILEATPRRFVVVVTDLQMPSMSGLELAGRIRQLDPELAIILHSGALPDELPAGLVDVALAKPCSMSDLGAQVRALAELRLARSDGAAAPQRARDTT